jgi:hypothetical protein
VFGLTLPRIDGDEPARWAVNLPATPLAIVD